MVKLIDCNVIQGQEIIILWYYASSLTRSLHLRTVMMALRVAREIINHMYLWGQTIYIMKLTEE